MPSCKEGQASEKHLAFMREALAEAMLAAQQEEIPVGCVIVRDNRIIARAHNLRETLHDPTAHAEMLAIRRAAEATGLRRLQDCTIYVTLEPCPMCAGAILMAEMKECYFGAKDTAQGCVESIYALTRDPAFYREVPSYGGLLEEECAEILRNFFHRKR